MNKKLIKQRFTKCLGSYDNEAITQYLVCSQLIRLLNKIEWPLVNNALEIGCGTGMMGKQILQNFTVKKIIFNDIVPGAFSYINALMEKFTGTKWEFVSGDAEETDFFGHYELVYSTSTIQWFANIDSFFMKIKNLLNKGGILAFSTFGPNNFRELKLLTGHSLSYLTEEEIKHKLINDFNILEMWHEEIKQEFNSPVDVLKHVKKTGVNGINGNKWTKRHLEDFCHQYTALFSNNGKVSLTYNPIYFILKKR